jgi:hypothetical protein
MGFEIGKRYAVFSVNKKKEGSVWIRAGSAWVNRDGSMNVYLDVLPLDGTLHIREVAGKEEPAPEKEE